MTYHPVEQLPWMDGAACANVGGDIWFPDRSQPRARAVRICGTCPVQGECLDYALEQDETFGIWGGLYGRQLARLKRKEVG